MSDLRKEEKNSALEKEELKEREESAEETGAQGKGTGEEGGAEEKAKSDGSDKNTEEKEEKSADSAEKSGEEGKEKGAESAEELSPTEKLDRAAHLISEVGDNKRAREIILEVLSSNPSVEDREYAEKLLRRIEMDVRALWVGVIAMLTLILIPTVGLAKALWVVPAIFLLLLPIVPGIIASVSFWVIPLFDSFFKSDIWKLVIPSVGVLLAFILILFMQASSEDESEETT